jgi:hypothetical protein
MMNGNELEGNGIGLVEILPQPFPGWTEEFHEKLLPGQPVSRSRFDCRTSHIKFCRVTCGISSWMI